MAVPSPEPGLVVHFNYLWSREFDRGRTEARYPRPCAVVVSYRRAADNTVIVMLAPITHAPPMPGDRAVELPQAVKAQLGLDDQRSWIMVDEVNESPWPGFDLQTDSRGRYACGMVPPRLFRRVRDEMLRVLRDGSLRRVPR